MSFLMRFTGKYMLIAEDGEMAQAVVNCARMFALLLATASDGLWNEGIFFLPTVPVPKIFCAFQS